MLEEKNVGNFTLRIDYENYPENPREWDNFTKMICFHRKYRLGDKHYYNHSDYNNWEEMKKDIIKNENVGVILPLYLYDHSGITISTTPFSCNFDSGQIGFIYVTRETIFENIKGYKILTKKLKQIVTERLLNELKCYDQYLTGEIYSFEILRDNERLEYCGGYYDKNECLEDGNNMMNDLINQNVIHQEIL